MQMVIENLDETARVLPYTPISLNPLGEWDGPRQHSEHFNLTFLFPLHYNGGDVELQEGLCLSMAIRVVRSCQAYDGGGVVWSVVRPRTGGKKVEANRWGPKPPKSGEAVMPPLEEVVAVSQK